VQIVILSVCIQSYLVFDFLQLFLVDISFLLMASHLRLKVVQDLSEAFKANRLVQLDVCFVSEVFDSETKHRVSTNVSCGLFCFAKKDGLLFQNVNRNLVVDVFLETSKTVVCVLQHLLGEELLDLERQRALLTIIFFKGIFLVVHV